jgi:acyl-coenzyme A synthetase/AMP-(fatty) acid ligase
VWLDDAAGLPWAGSFPELIEAAAADPELDLAFLDDLESEVTASDDAVMIHTSGSTALPKAVIHTHGPAARQLPVLADVHVAVPGERVICLLPMFWVGGMTMLLEVFIRGGCIVLPDGVSSRSVADALRVLGADAVHGWPAQCKAIRKLIEAEGLDISGIRGLRDERLPDGSLMPPDQVPNSLGMTETFGPHGASAPGVVLDDQHRGAFAPAFVGIARRVVDLATGAVLPPGHAGELQVRGGALMRGYHKRERSETFTADGYFATSDRVRIEADGYLYFEGRMGDMLKTRGANVSRLEVEAALRKIPGVAEAFVCGLPDADAGQLVAAAVAPAADERPTERSIRTALRALIAPYKIPAHIIVIDSGEFLWTATGKIRAADMSQLIARRLR